MTTPASTTSDHDARLDDDHKADDADTCAFAEFELEPTDYLDSVSGGGGLFEPIEVYDTVDRKPSRLDEIPSRVKIGFIAASFVAIIAVLFMLPGRNPFGDSHTVPIWLWILAPALLWVGVRQTPHAGSRLSRATPMAAISLGAITLAAILLRVIDIESIPFVMFGDEGEQGLEARRVIDGTITSPFWTGWLGVPTMSFYYNSFGLRIFGDNLFGLRMAWAVVGIVTVPLTYLLGRRLAGSVRFGLLSAALVAVYHFHIHYSRIGSVQISDALFLTAALWLYHRSFEHHLRQDWVALGIVTGLSMYFYAGARLTIFVIIALFVYQLICRRGLEREQWIGFGLFLIAFAVVAAPMLQFAVNQWSEFNARLTEVSITGPSGERWFEEQRARGFTDAEIWWDQFKRSLLAFNRYEDTTVWYNLDGPLLDRFFGLVFLLGLGVSTVKVFLFRDERFAPLVAWWWAGMLSGAFLTLNPPSTQRLVTLTVPAAMLVAVGIVTIASWLTRLHRELTYGRIMAVAGLAFSLISYNTYFNDHPRDLYGAGHSALSTGMAPYINALDPDQTVYFVGEPFVYWGYGTMQFLVDNHAERGVDLFRDEMTPALVQSLGQGTDRLVFAVAVERAGELDMIRSIWPDGDTQEILYSDGRKIGEIYSAPTGLGPQEPVSRAAGVDAGPVPPPETLPTGQVWRSLGVNGIGEVRGIDVRPDGSGAVVVDLAGLIVSLDAEGARTRLVEVTTTPAEFTDVVVDTTGTVWTVDAQGARLFRVDPDGTVRPLVADPGSLMWVRGIGPGVDGTLWVASPASGRLTQVAGADGSTVQTIELVGRQPVDAIGLPNGDVWYVDAENFDLVKMSPDGTELVVVDLPGFTSVEPAHLDLIGDVIWVSDPEASTARPYDASTGTALTDPLLIERPPTGRLDKPVGIAVGPDSRIWTVDAKRGAIAITPPS